MTGSSVPAADPWTLAVHRAETGFAPAGTAVAVAPRVALTCAHVVLDGFDEPGGGRLVAPLWVSFPKVASLWKVRRLVERVGWEPDYPQLADVAVLYLAEDMPAVVEPARIKLLEPEVLARRQGREGVRWWAFGFPASSRRTGSEATGTVGAALAHGWVRLDTQSRYLVEKGFSGGGLWLPEYQAVAGIVGQAIPAEKRRGGDAQALTLAQAAVFLPSAKLQVLAGWAAADAGAAAMAAWGWTLDEDPEAGRHWRPRARGVTSDAEAGYRFRGRRAALTHLVEWLDRPVLDRRVLVVTGSPGVGKSAVLGRVVTTADRRLRAALPGGDTGVLATVGSVACAVHVKGKTALDVAGEIARAAGAVMPDRVEDLAGEVRAVLAGRTGRFNVVLDAVDEAASVRDARLVLTGVVLPLVQTCGDLGVQVVCGSRRFDGGGPLLGVLGGAAVEIDLDDEAYFELADLVAYTEATLRLVGSERPGNPYADPAVAAPVAARIAALTEPNFLVAGLDARGRGLYDTVAVDPATLRLTADVDAALDAYLDRVPPVHGTTDARAVLAALAYAEAPGWPAEVWQTATAAFGSPVDDVHLDRFARSAAASFLVETSTAADGSAFRLFHQALNDALIRGRGPGGPAVDERRLTRALHALGRERGWASAPWYLLRSLPGHADRAGRIDDLLTDDDYLLYADLLRLLPAADRATTDAGRDRARLINLTPQAVTAPPPQRAAMFSITQTLEQLAPLRTTTTGPYHGRWAAVRHRNELRRLDGHTGGVRAVCPVVVGGRTLLATAGDDGSVRLWDPATGQQQRQLDGHTDWVRAVCPVVVDGRTLLATASNDGSVRLWDPATGQQQRQLDGHTGAVRAVCPVVVDGRTLLATASDAALRLWDPATGQQQRQLDGHTGWVNGVCPVVVDGRTLLATAGDDGSVRLWDPATGQQQRQLDGHTGAVRAVCPVVVDGRTLLATASDAALRLWDPATGQQQRQLDGHTDWVRAACPVVVDGRTLLATAGDDGSVRLWDPATGQQQRQLDGHTDWVRAVCPVVVDGRTLLATASDDGSVRLWDPATGQQQRQLDGHTGWVNGVCPVVVDGRTLLATASNDGSVRLWDPATGQQQRQLDGHTGWVNGVCPVVVDGRTLLATASTDGSVRLWDPATGQQQRQLDGHTGWVNGVCPVVVDGRTLLATASNDGSVRLWDPATGQQQRQLDGHTGWVNGVCPVVVDGRTLLATASNDGSVRLWDPATGHCLWTMPLHHPALACAAVRDGIAVALDVGIIVVDLLGDHISG
ncbi:hypothetical protein [Dactylosporangium sp. CA-139066]|uniref:hypothetical protein n=1 Tax=Dactylosporangium sp. CA-139066 TaxID=3239930 RepID=UPI003D8BFAAA